MELTSYSHINQRKKGSMSTRKVPKSQPGELAHSEIIEARSLDREQLINKSSKNSEMTDRQSYSNWSQSSPTNKIPVFEKRDDSCIGKIGTCLRSFTESGSIPNSTFALIVMCLGSGTVTIPYVFYANGIIASSLMIVAGGSLSYYTGMLIAYCAAQTGGKSFEEIAFKLYGE